MISKFPLVIVIQVQSLSYSYAADLQIMPRMRDLSPRILGEMMVFVAISGDKISGNRRSHYLLQAEKANPVNAHRSSIHLSQQGNKTQRFR